MRKPHAIALVFAFGCSGDPPSNAAVDAAPKVPDAMPADAETTTFSFFISSTSGPKGGDFRRDPAETDGLAGADEFCRAKAIAAVPAAATRQWRAYLSTSTVHARDRIGAGPWFNRAGVMVAADVANLHDEGGNNLNKMTATDENGNVVNGVGDKPNEHDILTGSLANGTPAPTHCNNWTSSEAMGVSANVGHHDRDGGGAAKTSWNAAHASAGCSAQAFVSTGGRGSIYCFAM